MSDAQKPTSLRSVKEPKKIPREIIDGLGKLPPQALELEEVILGAALLEKPGQLIALEKLTPDDFYAEYHKEIFQAMVDLSVAGAPIDMRTVINQLKKTGKLELVGGPVVIAELTAKVASAANIEYYCMVIIEKRLARDIIEFCSRMQSEAYEDTTDSFSLVDQITKFPLSLMDGIKAGTERHIKDGIIALNSEMNERKENAPEITGVPSGFDRLDRVTAGWQNSDLIIIAARPSMGKTTFVVNALRNAAVEFKIPVAIFSLEMSYRQLVNKITSAETDITLRTLTSRLLTPVDWTNFNSKIGPLSSSPIYIDDPSSLSITDLRIRCRRLKEKYGVKIIAVDYLQLMKGEHGSKGNREQEISGITRGLKQIAKELDIPILALSQLSREVDKRPLPRIPVLSDLRESGSIEQDADIVAFLWRPEYYKIMGDEGGTFVQGLTKVIFAKHRNGALAEPCVAMHGGTSKFRSVDSPYLDSSDARKQNDHPSGGTIIRNPAQETKKNDDSEDMPF
jgi:replicative DNA helicase